MTGKTGFDKITEFQKLLTQAFATRKGQVEKARLSQASLQGSSFLPLNSGALESCLTNSQLRNGNCEVRI